MVRGPIMRDPTITSSRLGSSVRARAQQGDGRTDWQHTHFSSFDAAMEALRADLVDHGYNIVPEEPRLQSELLAGSAAVQAASREQG